MLRESLAACPVDARKLTQNPAIFATAASLIHAHNVLDFLYPRRRSFPEDILADEFTGGRWSHVRPDAAGLLLAGLSLTEMRKRLDTELAHLSYGRMAARDADDQLWRYAGLLAKDLLALADRFLAILEDPERNWFEAIPNSDRVWLVESILPSAERNTNDNALPQEVDHAERRGQ
jgi:hypothetical protein